MSAPITAKTTFSLEEGLAFDCFRLGEPDEIMCSLLEVCERIYFIRTLYPHLVAETKVVHTPRSLLALIDQAIDKYSCGHPATAAMARQYTEQFISALVADAAARAATLALWRQLAQAGGQAHS